MKLKRPSNIEEHLELCSVQGCKQVGTISLAPTAHDYSYEGEIALCDPHWDKQCVIDTKRAVKELKERRAAEEAARPKPKPKAVPKALKRKLKRKLKLPFVRRRR